MPANAATINSVTFDTFEEYDGMVLRYGCHNLSDRNRSIYDDNSTTVHIASSGSIVKRVIFGSQTLQWFYVCSYNDKNYLLPIGFNNDIIAGQAETDATHPFTGKVMSFPTTNTQIYLSNPFEQIKPVGCSRIINTLYVKTPQDDFKIEVRSSGAMAQEMEFFPFDDVLKLKISKICYDKIEITSDIPKELGKLAEEEIMMRAIINTETISSQPSTIPSDRFYKSGVTVMVSDIIKSKPTYESIQTALESWYLDLYGDFYTTSYTEKSGVLPNISDVVKKYNNIHGTLEKMITYRDIVIEVDIPLIIKSKDSRYAFNYPDIGWCNPPFTLVAKETTNKTKTPVACVMPDTAPKLIKRGWAQEMPHVSQETQDQFEDKIAKEGFVYRYDKADPMDSFRASLLGYPHADDIETRGNITPGPSNNQTLRQLLGQEVLEQIKPPYSNMYYRLNDLNVTLEEYQRMYKVCADGYDYYLKEMIEGKKFVIVQFNC